MKWQVIGLGVAALLFVIQPGCNPPAQNGTSQDGAAGGSDAHHDEHGQDDHHDEKGPNGGQIIDLGKGEYHAELLHDEEAGRVTIHLLDSKLKEAVLAAQDGVRINVSLEGVTGSYPLEAVDSADGKASQFQIVHPVVNKAVDAKGEVTRLLAVTIDGKSYTEEIAGHDHDHDHGHGHGDHDEGDDHDEGGHHEGDDHDDDHHDD